MKIWTLPEEAEHLSKRFEGINRAEFARAHPINGGPSMIYQHMTGRRPMSQEAAIVYAQAFFCPLEEISPRIAIEVANAAALIGDNVAVRDAAVLPMSEAQIEWMMLVESLTPRQRDVFKEAFKALILAREPSAQAAHEAKSVIERHGARQALFGSPDVVEKKKRQKANETTDRDASS